MYNIEKIKNFIYKFKFKLIDIFKKNFFNE